MTTIFLSYSKRDEVVGQGIAQALVDRGFEVYWWQDPKRAGGRFQNEIEQMIYAADRFVAVMSPAYLHSPWCIRERNMAVQLENRGRHGFIAVFEAAPVDDEWTGWLVEYARIEVRGTDWDATVAGYVKTVSGVDTRPPDAGPRRARGPEPKFRNREQELDQIVDELTVDGGIDVWLVSAPPQLGKSWFLYQLADQVTERVRERHERDCQVRVLDVKDHRWALRSDPLLLLRTMLNLASPLPDRAADLTPAHLNAVAAEISRRRRQQLYMLDSADLLEAQTPEPFLWLLNEVFQRLTAAGSRTRVGVVVSGRQVDKWRLMSGVRARKKRLTGFSDDVVRAALADLAGEHHSLGPERIVALARRLHLLCEGLPALLVRVLERIAEHDFIGVDDDAWWQAAFDEVVRPYVRDELLAVDSLFPAGGRELGEHQALIELGLRVLSPYRMVTRSHVLFHVDRDSALRDALDKAGWRPSQLLKALHDTALVVPVPDKPWHEIHRPIRRLLYRYYYSDGPECEAVQRLAQQYYGSGCEKPAGTEQPVMLIEYVWHEFMRRSTGVTGEGLDDLPEFAASATDDFVRHSMYSAHELDQFASQLLEGDVELELALSGHPGLFDAVRGSILAAIEAVADD